MGRGAELQSLVAGAIRGRERDALVDALAAADVPVAPVLDRTQMLAQPHFRERAVATADPWADPAIGYPVRLASHAAARVTPPPGLDEHRGSGFLPRTAP